MSREVNRNPRRWVDQSGRVRVVEGWHPSEPGRTGYNLIVDGDWVGTFGTLDSAATEAAACIGLENGAVALLSCVPARGRAGKARRSGLHLVRDASSED
jgi:hypothetical protein